jgi:transcriptional regulator with XRE-family HTH domain
MLLRHAIGFVLRRRRLELDKTLRQLAEDARISLPYVSEIERGRKEASSEILSALCKVLDLTEQQLLEDVAAEFAAQYAADGAAAYAAQRVAESREVVSIDRGAQLLAA